MKREEELRLKREEDIRLEIEKKLKLQKEEKLKLETKKVQCFEMKLESWRKKYKDFKLPSFKSNQKLSTLKKHFQQAIQKQHSLSNLLPFTSDDFLSGNF